MLESKYGHFSENGREYIITNPITPRPWSNVISNGDYSIVISQTGGGYSFRHNAEQCRLTRAYQDLIKDNWGKYFYIRDLSDGSFWTTSYLPVKDSIDSYTVTHGVGYSVLERTTKGIKSRHKLFVSHDMPMEYAEITLENCRNESVKMDLTGYFEWAPGIAFDTHREFQKLFVTTSFDSADNAIILNKCLWGFPDEKGRFNNDDWPYTAFFASSVKASSFDCDKESFIGMYNDEKTPSAMYAEKLSNNCGRYGDPVGALRTEEIRLKPNESVTVVFVIGMAKNGVESCADMLARCTAEQCGKDFAEVEEKWNALLNAEKVATPDKAFDTMTNIWCKYQTLSGRMWAKCGYYQISGGIGFRDQLQDSLLMLDVNPEMTAKQILLHASRQFQAGDVQHWWLEIGGAGPRTKCSDDFLWLSYATEKYIEETADFSILDCVVPFVDGGESATLYEHCKRTLALAFERLSPRGIPLMGDHDWNDGLSAVGNDMKGESFWVAEFLYDIAVNFRVPAEYKNDKELSSALLNKCEKLKASFEKYAWDGEWYLQATNDGGELLGSASCKNGKVFLNPQVWAVISGIADSHRRELAMEAVGKYLLKDYGALLLYPQYDSPDKNIGYITRYAPGLRENGGVYTHAATWAVWAYSILGDGEKAYEAYRKICPPNRASDIDEYYCEPYVLCGNSDGPASPHYGRGGWSWYTGSAQWLHNVAVHCILGVKPTMAGLKIEPCIPAAWDGFKYERKFRGAVYRVTCSRGGSKGLFADGKRVAGNILPDFRDGEHEIVIVI